MRHGAAGRPAAPGAFADEMLVMAHLSSLQASQFLQSLRRLGVPPIALKAMLTPTKPSGIRARCMRNCAKSAEAISHGAASVHAQAEE